MDFPTRLVRLYGPKGPVFWIGDNLTGGGGNHFQTGGGVCALAESPRPRGWLGPGPDPGSLRRPPLSVPSEALGQTFPRMGLLEKCPLHSGDWVTKGSRGLDPPPGLTTPKVWYFW